MPKAVAKGKNKNKEARPRREWERRRNDTRISIRDEFFRWKTLMARLGLNSDALMAKFLLDLYVLLLWLPLVYNILHSRMQ